MLSQLLCSFQRVEELRVLARRSICAIITYHDCYRVPEEDQGGSEGSPTRKPVVRLQRRRNSGGHFSQLKALVV